MKKRILILALALCLALTLLPFGAAAADSGSCGDNVSWTLNESGLLLISGSGEMTDYASYDKSPFYNNSDIKKIIIGNGVTSIGNYAFFCCPNVSTVTIPSSVTRIGEGSFSLCYALGGVTIPYSVTSIDDYAFYGCAALGSITIPGQVEHIGDSALAGCIELQTIVVTSSNTRYCSENGVLFSKDKTALLQVPAGVSGTYAIPEGVERIGVSAFEHCLRLTGITIPSSVTSIGNYAFSDCMSVEGIFIPAGVTSIGEKAFTGCSELKDVWFGGTESRWTEIGGEGTALPDEAQLHFDMLRISSHPQDAAVDEGKTASFTVSAAGPDLTYQWQYKTPGTDAWYRSGLDGADTPTLTVSATEARSGYQYRCVVTNGYGTVTSDAATLTVNLKPRITAQPQSISAEMGKTVRFTVNASGEGLTYQWQYRKPGATTWYNSTQSGNKTATLSVEATAARSDFSFRCVVKNAVGSVASDAAVLTVQVPKPEITGQPKSVTAAVGQKVQFTVKATGPDLTYQWQYRKSGSSTWYNSTSSGNKTATLRSEARRAGNECRSRWAPKHRYGTATSSAATLTTATKPVITTQPKSASGPAGETVKFTVKAVGPDLTYQWQYRKPGATTWYKSTQSGSKTATLTVEVTAARSGFSYRCVIKNSYGTTTSNIATLTTLTVPAITGQPQSITASVGGTAQFTVKASGGDLTYQWQYRKPGATSWYNSTQSGSKTATLSVEATAARNGFEYRCIVKNSLGSATSSAAKLTVN